MLLWSNIKEDAYGTTRHHNKRLDNKSPGMETQCNGKRKRQIDARNKDI